MEQDNNIKLIIDKLIKLIPFYGISDDTLLKACINLDLTNSFCKFQNGIYSALEYIAENFNNSVESELENLNLKNIEIKEKLKIAIQTYLSKYYEIPNYKEFLKKILLFSIFPKNIYFSNKLLYSITDTILYGICDKSTDFSYYRKRFILALAYLRIVFFFINDYSEDFVETMSFIDKCINKIIIFQKF